MNDDVAAALPRIPVFAGRALDDLRVEPLASLTNRNFKLMIGADAFVLRLAGAGTDRYIDRAAELHNARLAASLGITPEVLHADPAAGLMLTRFIPGGAPLADADLRCPDMLRSAVGLLKRLHDCKLPFIGQMDLFPKLDHYMALAARRGWPDGLDLTRHRDRAEAAHAALERENVPLVPSHIDPVPDNFVIGHDAGRPTRLHLLDWEYSAMCEPMWDLAALSIEAGFSPEQDRFLLETYFMVPTSSQRGRFALFKMALTLLASAWAVLQLVDGNPRADFAAYARDRLVRHAEFSDSAAFRDYVAEVT